MELSGEVLELDCMTRLAKKRAGQNRGTNQQEFHWGSQLVIVRFFSFAASCESVIVAGRALKRPSRYPAHLFTPRPRVGAVSLFVFL
jgi:hypothetical protein